MSDAVPCVQLGKPAMDGGRLTMAPKTSAMRRDVVQLLALCRLNLVDWSLLAREARRPDGMRILLSGELTERRASAQNRRGLKQSLEHGLPLTEVADQLTGWLSTGLKLTTVLDEDYPLNLRMIHNLPPFLFYRGRLQADDSFSVAVVGTREPTTEGLTRARDMARKLAKGRVTVLSGLARGIDAAAHAAALDAGGRTIAVLGSGLFNVYPPENRRLAERIADSGAVVSQFWPYAAPAKYNFPIRNIVTSGLGQGTVVIEASATSGAKMQARLALEHGKLVFVLRSLVETHKWAQDYKRRGAIEVQSVEEVIQQLRSVEALQTATVQQGRLALQFA